MSREDIPDARTGLFGRGFNAGLHVGMPPGEFDLPHPATHPRVFILVHRVLAEAFSVLRTDRGSLAAMGEDEITAQLYHILENDLYRRRSRRRDDAIPGFDEGHFEAVSRHSGATDYTGERLKKEPDLFFKLKPSFGFRVLPSEYAIFVECKPVDGKHAVGGKYADDGMVRFVKGEYAWAMQDALMVGYVRSRSIKTHLLPAMRSRQRALKTEKLPAVVPSIAFPQAAALHVSLHGRSFQWCWGKGKACSMNIYHSWHDCS